MRTVPVRALFQREKVLGHVEEPMLSVYREHGVMPKDETTNLNKTAEDRSIYQLVEPGWLVVNRMKAWQGSVGISAYRGIVSGHYICFRPRHSEHDRYLNWLLRSAPMTARFGAISRGVRTGQIEIDNDDLASTRVPLPQIDEQRRIADFLDDQVARIDATVAARQEQVTLLDELATVRASDLFESFTTRFGSAPLRRFVSGIEQGGSPNGGEPGGAESFAVLKTSAIKAGRFDPHENKALLEPMDFDSRYEIQDGDVLVVRGSGSGDLVADAAEVRLHVGSPRIMLSDLVYRVVRPTMRSDFVVSALLCPQARSQVRSLVRQGSGPAKARGEDVLAIDVPSATSAGQAAFATAYWQLRDDQMQTSDRLQESIDLLIEYKRSLITAAVTGELDVTTARSGVAV